MKYLPIISFFCFFLFVKQTNASLALMQLDSSLNQRDTLVVGVKISPPFIMKNGLNYEGLSIDLWTKLAEKLNVEYEFKLYNLSNLLIAIENGEVDICISPMTVTSDRIKMIDFSQPFYTSNLSIAVPSNVKDSIATFINNFFSLNFFKAIFILLMVLLMFGFFIWLAENKNNSHFAKGIKGVADGMWWAAVTMTTVGYGDKTPKSPFGRVIAVIWMFTAIIIISSLTASITTALTVKEMSSKIETVNDLKSTVVGTIENSASARFLIDNEINRLRYFNDVESGLHALASEKIDAFVYDEPIIRYLIQKEGLDDKLQIVPNDFLVQYYSFSFPKNDSLMQRVNPILMEELESIEWKATLNKYNLNQ